jgi:hypothetical protein
MGCVRGLGRVAFVQIAVAGIGLAIVVITVMLAINR